MNNTNMLHLNHALTDRNTLTTVIQLLVTDNDIFREYNTKCQAVVKLLEGQIQLLDLAFKDDVEYLFLWLSFIDCKNTFTPEVAEYLLSEIRKRNRFLADRLYGYLFPKNLTVTCDPGKPFTLNPDVLEALKNASKYAHTYVDISLDKKSRVVITNDVNPSKVSGTQMGLSTYHPDIDFTISGNVATAKVKVEIIPNLSMKEMVELTKEAGWSITPNINDAKTNSRILQQTKEMFNIKESILLENNKVVKTAKKMLLDIFKKHIDCPKLILVTECFYHEGICVSVGLEYYDGYDYFM